MDWYFCTVTCIASSSTKVASKQEEEVSSQFKTHFYISFSKVCVVLTKESILFSYDGQPRLAKTACVFQDLSQQNLYAEIPCLLQRFIFNNQLKIFLEVLDMCLIMNSTVHPWRVPLFKFHYFSFYLKQKFFSYNISWLCFSLPLFPQVTQHHPSNLDHPLSDSNWKADYKEIRTEWNSTKTNDLK